MEPFIQAMAGNGDDGGAESGTEDDEEAVVNAAPSKLCPYCQPEYGIAVTKMLTQRNARPHLTSAHLNSEAAGGFSFRRIKYLQCLGNGFAGPPNLRDGFIYAMTGMADLMKAGIKRAIYERLTKRATHGQRTASYDFGIFSVFEYVFSGRGDKASMAFTRNMEGMKVEVEWKNLAQLPPPAERTAQQQADFEESGRQMLGRFSSSLGEQDIRWSSRRFDTGGETFIHFSSPRHRVIRLAFLFDYTLHSAPVHHDAAAAAAADPHIFSYRHGKIQIAFPVDSC